MRARSIPVIAFVVALAFGALAQAEVSQHGSVRVSFNGKLIPHTLPREGAVPVRVSVGATIGATNRKKRPPQLRRIAIAINRNGRFDFGGLPVCTLKDIQPSTNTNALAVCGLSKVGVGNFSARVLLPQQSPFPSDGKVVAFNGVFRGQPAILAHVYGTHPVPTSYTIPFEIMSSKGTFGTVLSAYLPQATSDSGYVTGLSLTLGRNYTYRGQRRSFLSAACPAPKGISKVSFPFARASFGFGKKVLTSTLTRNCRVRS